MKHIKTITDMDVTGKPTISHSKPRLTARGVVVNTLGEIALLYSHEYKIYSLPGGGVEPGEDILSALYREIHEETGCNIISVSPIGTVEENRGFCNYRQISYYFSVTTDSTNFAPKLTEAEKNYGTTINWHTPSDAYSKLSLNEHLSNVGLSEHQKNKISFLRFRDLAAFKEYLNIQNIKI